MAPASPSARPVVGRRMQLGARQWQFRFRTRNNHKLMKQASEGRLMAPVLWSSAAERSYVLLRLGYEKLFEKLLSSESGVLGLQ